MNDRLKEIRAALDARAIDIAALGKSRELALALTTCQQSRMLLGICLQQRGEVTPYPKADDPKSPEIAPPADAAPTDYAPQLPEGDVATVKEVRRRIGETIAALGDLRRHIWARDYGSIEEVVYDRAYCELVLARNWLGLQLAELAKPKVKKESKAR